MCGIVGYSGPKEPLPILIGGLSRLEYRGYDSAGLAVVNMNGSLEVRRAAGKLENLEAVLENKPLVGSFGVGHTRWATHGGVNRENAHPHLSQSGEFAIVHNGIIENYVTLKKYLSDKGHEFKSQTDTEVLAALS